jgi:hypothetical protein
LALRGSYVRYRSECRVCGFAEGRLEVKESDDGCCDQTEDIVSVHVLVILFRTDSHQPKREECHRRCLLTAGDAQSQDSIRGEDNNGQVNDDVNESRNQPEWHLGLNKSCSQCYARFRLTKGMHLPVQISQGVCISHWNTMTASTATVHKSTSTPITNTPTLCNVLSTMWWRNSKTEHFDMLSTNTNSIVETKSFS